jgi:aspartate 1-decarboxylase
LIHVGDTVILIAYQSMPDAEARAFRPRVVHVDATNRILAVGADPSEGSAPHVSRPPYAIAMTPFGRLR